ncbi:MAG: amidohydrolase family protein, partial [Gammaproteobacteria bacterium]|nr:amidohydrolase family protein [Gammaproteobacteria bacterium]
MNKPLPKLALAAALTTALITALWGCQDKAKPAAGHPSAERVFLHGAIYTADPQQHTVSAIAVNGDRIVFVGDDEAAASWVGADTVVTDLEGKRVLPGLQDAHVHPAGVIEVEDCNLDNQPVNLAELAAFAAACIERLQVPDGDWLLVKQWNFAQDNKPAEDLKTLRQALDRASTTHPILLGGSDGHHNATNSAGLARATTAAGEQLGLSAATLAGPFAELAPYVGLDAQGEPNGEVHEDVPKMLGTDRAILGNVSALIPEAGQIPARFNSLGITSIYDAAFDATSPSLYDGLVEQGKLSLRVTLAQYYDPNAYKNADGKIDIEAIMTQARATREKYSQVANVKADQLKYFVDGVIEGNPLSTPPTLPNAAQLRDYYQPIFGQDERSGDVVLRGYVDPDGEACKPVAQGLARMSREAITAFIAANGFHPAQCLRSNGVMFQSEATTVGFIRAAVANDFSVHFHAIGDRAVRTAVDAIAAVTTGTPATNRHSIAHAQLVTPEDVARIAALKIPVAFTYAWAVRDYGYDVTVIPFIDKISSLQDMYKPENYYLRQAYPAHSILAAGGVLAAGSDAPVDTADPRPFHNIEKAVTRDEGEGPMNAGEDIGILDAIDAYTINGARLMHQQDITGSLEAGKKADFIILDRD